MNANSRSFQSLNEMAGCIADYLEGHVSSLTEGFCFIETPFLELRIVFEGRITSIEMKLVEPKAVGFFPPPIRNTQEVLTYLSDISQFYRSQKDALQLYNRARIAAWKVIPSSSLSPGS